MADQLNLNITDLADVVKVIDHIAEQGVLRGWALFQQVGALRERLNEFVGITTAGTTSETPLNLNITDLADAVKVIDYGADQGAYRGWTLIGQVIALRDRLNLFVAAATAAESQNSASQDTSQAA